MIFVSNTNLLQYVVFFKDEFVHFFLPPLQSVPYGWVQIKIPVMYSIPGWDHKVWDQKLNEGLMELCRHTAHVPNLKICLVAFYCKSKCSFMDFWRKI